MSRPIYRVSSSCSAADRSPIFPGGSERGGCGMGPGEIPSSRHSLMVLLALPDASVLPSGLNATAKTPLSWPINREWSSSSPVLAFVIGTSSSEQANAMRFPSALNATRKKTAT